jgi:hypothetical protein
LLVGGIAVDPLQELVQGRVLVVLAPDGFVQPIDYFLVARLGGFSLCLSLRIKHIHNGEHDDDGYALIEQPGDYFGSEVL